MEKTKGFVLKSLKYSDTSAIFQVYTEDFAMLSLLIKGFYSSKNKKNRFIQYPFTQIEFNFRKNANLVHPCKIQSHDNFINAHQNPLKLMILQFLAEVIYTTLKEDEPNAAIYNFINHQLSIFNKKETQFAEFHLLLLANLTKLLGFYPNSKNDSLPFFDLNDGQYTDNATAFYKINKEESIHWKSLFQQNFSIQYINQFKPDVRQNLLKYLLDYYILHVPGFRTPKSLEVLRQLI